jgi:hypothetical protein
MANSGIAESADAPEYGNIVRSDRRIERLTLAQTVRQLESCSIGRRQLGGSGREWMAWTTAPTAHLTRRRRSSRRFQSGLPLVTRCAMSSIRSPWGAPDDTPPELNSRGFHSWPFLGGPSDSTPTGQEPPYVLHDHHAEPTASTPPGIAPSWLEAPSDPPSRAGPTPGRPTPPAHRRGGDRRR